MEILRSIIIGGIQGISEFFPISSSGHLVLIPYIFKWNYQGLSFDVALHFGTVLAIIAFFWREWIDIIKSAFTKKQSSFNFPKNIFWQIVVASIPAAIFGLLVNKIVEKYFHSPILIAINLIVFGVILWLADKFAQKKIEIKNIKYPASFIVGCAQALALVPGVSRSGITMTASRYLGLDRESATKFSFLLATPAMLGAFLLEFKDIRGNDLNPIFIFGTIASTIFGFLAIKYLLQYLKNHDYKIFVWYRIIIALVVMTIYFLK